MLPTLIPPQHRAEAGAHILALMTVVGLVTVDRIGARRVRERLRIALGVLGFITGVYASWLARRSALLASQLVEEHERRQTLISAVAHELNNRVTPIMAYAQVLERMGEAPTPLEKRAATAVVREARLLTRLVADLLDTSRIQSGRLGIRTGPVDLVAIARAVVEGAQLTTERHRLTLDAPERVEGHWDRDRIAQALTNLIDNAIKYSPEGGVVEVTIRQGDGVVAVCVTDQGIGLSPEEIPLLFVPYSRVYRERRAKGLGLGLFITRGIVEAHGGRITATSPGLGQGSTFCFTLPNRPASDR